MTDIDGFHVTQEHHNLKDAINSLGEKVSRLNARQDSIESQIEKILVALEHNGKTEEDAKANQEKMVQSIEKLTTLLGNIQIDMARNEATALKMIDEKLEDVYSRLNDNRDLMTREYTTTNQLYKQIGAVYALVVIIAVMAWTNYTEFKNRTTLEFSALRSEHKGIKTEMKAVLTERAERCESDMQNIRDSVKEHKH